MCAYNYCGGAYLLPSRAMSGNTDYKDYALDFWWHVLKSISALPRAAILP